MSLAAGTRLGSYEIVSSLGRGAMGEVYRATDRKLGREVAIKVLQPELAGDAERVRRFEQEALAASALNHPNIVHIYDIGEASGTRYLVMELVEGVTLRQLLAEAPLEAGRLVDLGRQIAEGLAKAHAAGIVHRDLKPENVMVTPDGFVKILDFGLAKLSAVPFAMSSDMATLAQTRHGMLIGTVEYMSPEQASGKSLDYRSDQFSLGLILYEMATGKLAFRRGTAAQTLASIIESEPTPMAQVNPDRPRGLDAVVERCLAKDPEGRYRDTREIANVLRVVSRNLAEPGADRVPGLGKTLGSYVEREVGNAIGEVERELRGAPEGDSLYHLDSEGKVRRLSESRLRKRLRSNRYSGVEMVRREGEEAWVPLHQTRLFEEEVPHRGDPGEWAAKRKLMGFLQHLAVYVSFGFASFFATGEVPVWMGFWGIGLASHAVGAAPAAMKLLRGKRLPLLEVRVPERGESEAADRLPLGLREEVSRVRELLARRGGERNEELLRDLDGIVGRMRELSSWKRDLEEQTSVAERDRLQNAEEEASRRAEAAGTARDRKLYQRQLEVVRRRRQTIDKALAVLERLRVREDVALHQVKQLRLDLARGEASSASLPELSSRLQDIRHEVDAVDEVDEVLARELTS